MKSVELLPGSGQVGSLWWDGDELVDLVGGGRRWQLDGAARDTSIRWGHPFDQAVVSPSGRYAVIYVERGTKGIVVDLSGPKVVREIDRSYYHSSDYDYPVALGQLPDGREILVHCPEHYNELQIDDLETGQRLTEGARQSADVFHSRLAVSPDGRHLLVAGWLWAPLGVALAYDLAAALADPGALDEDTMLHPFAGIDAEVASACWLDGDRLALATTDESLEWDETPALGTRQLGVWSLSQRRWLHHSAVDYRIGSLLARGSQVVSLYDHPQLIDTETGTVIAQWPEVRVPEKDGAFGVTHIPTPVAAISPDGTRLAVAQEDGIALIELPNHERS
ncbi:hypothetical protein [Kitasatospora acidiphila]|uniref:hypothetical protein n=1 Tax=Kitasatospora acidiphila TaxID=2567942 RepID=UPI003C776930